MGIVLISAYFASLSPLALFRALPGSIAQGLIWGLLALGVYITYKLLDFADLSVDGSFATGGAVAVMLIRSDMNPWVSLIFAFAAGMLAGMVTGLLHTKLGIPPILAGILTQIALYSINLNIMGQSNQAISVDKYSLAVSLRYVSGDTAAKIKVFTTCILFGVVIVAILYWYFGTEQGHSIRATGCNPQMARAQGICTVSGCSGCQYGTRRNRYRSGCRYYRRCTVWKTVCRKETGICIYAVFRDRWSDHLLPCAEHHFVAEIPIG